MFSVYGIQGRIFSGTLEQWRRVEPVTASAPVAAVRETGAERQSPARADAAGHPGEGDTPRGAIAAYARTQQGDTHRHPLTRVAEVMSRRPVTIVHDAPLSSAWQLLSQHEVGQLPAVDAKGVLVGLLLRADLLRALAQPDAARDATAWLQMMMRRVGTLMRTPVPCALADTALRRVAQVLLDTALPGLPVVDDHGVVLGFVSRTDILRAVAADPPLELWA